MQLGLAAGALTHYVAGFVSTKQLVLVKRGQGVHPAPLGGMPACQHIDIAALPPFGAGAEMWLLCIGPAGRGRRKPNAAEEENAKWVRFALASGSFISNVSLQTHAALPTQNLAHNDMEVPTVLTASWEDKDILLHDAGRVVRRMAPEAAGSFDEWVRSAEEYLEQSAPQWWLGQRRAWRNQWYHKYLAGMPQPVAAPRPDYVDFRDHPDSLAMALCRELFDRDPTDFRVLAIVVDAEDCGIEVVLKQCEDRAFVEWLAMSFQGFHRHRVQPPHTKLMDKLAHRAEKQGHQEALVLDFLQGEAPQAGVAMCNAIDELSRVYRTARSQDPGSQSVKMTQHVVVFCRKPCDYLLNFLSQP